MSSLKRQYLRLYMEFMLRLTSALYGKMYFSRFDCLFLFEKIPFWKWGQFPKTYHVVHLLCVTPPPSYVVVYGASKDSQIFFTCCSSCRLQEVLSNDMSCVAFERTRTPNEARVIKGSLPFCKNYALLVKTNMLVKTNTAIVFVRSCLKNHISLARLCIRHTETLSSSN